ncbi:hypothetical protein HDV06_001922 [Boothiomyces sp. JEL0866]|nr:hypothetical protein HDV06_001922 [Boothiomyces sp. JEL0866]
MFQNPNIGASAIASVKDTGVFRKEIKFQSQQEADFDLEWLNIGGVVSMAMGILGGIALSASSILTPTKLLLHFPKLFPLYITLISYKTLSITSLNSKKVVSATVLALNLFMAGIYFLLAFGITPRIPGFGGLCYIEPARNTKIIYAQYVAMFLAQVLPAYFDFLLLGEVLLFGWNLFKTHLLFQEAHSSKQAMMDKTSLIFAKLVIFGGQLTIQYAWLMKTSLFLSTANAEFLMSVGDAIAIGGITVIVSLSKMKELKEL